MRLLKVQKPPLCWCRVERRGVHARPHLRTPESHTPSATLFWSVPFWVSTFATAVAARARHNTENFRNQFLWNPREKSLRGYDRQIPWARHFPLDSQVLSLHWVCVRARESICVCFKGLCHYSRRLGTERAGGWLHISSRKPYSEPGWKYPFSTSFVRRRSERKWDVVQRSASILWTSRVHLIKMTSSLLESYSCWDTALLRITHLVPWQNT